MNATGKQMQQTNQQTKIQKVADMVDISVLFLLRQGGANLFGQYTSGPRIFGSLRTKLDWGPLARNKFAEFRAALWMFD